MKQLGKKTFKYKRVLIYWNDILSLPDWVENYHMQDQEYCKTCVSIGWLHSKTKDMIKIFSSYNTDDKGEVDDFGDLKIYPMSVIRKVEYL